MVKDDDRSTTGTEGTGTEGTGTEGTGTEGTGTGQEAERPTRGRLGRRIRVFPPKAARRAASAGGALPGLDADGPAALAVSEDVPSSDAPAADAPATDPQDTDDRVMSLGDQGAAEASSPSVDVPEQSPTGVGSRRPASFSLLFQAPPTPTADPIEALADAASAREDDRGDSVGIGFGRGDADRTAFDRGDADTDVEGGSARRSRRRSRGKSVAAEESAEQVVEVAPRARPPREQITEPQKVKGSTRLEAKRQRRRDGRDAGRRRTVVTEAEFLARREAVDRVMIVRSDATHIEIGVLEDGILAEHYLAKNANVSLIGNVYLGRVQNVLPSMEAAFVDIGRGRNAVLYSGEVDWEAASDRLGDKGSQARRIELALKSGDRVLVQVTKDPIGHKGSRLTSSVSLPGRYLVYVPNGSMSGISRKLPDTERTRLKRILKDALPDSAGVIVRTAAEGAAEGQLTVDVQRLANQWAEIEHLAATATAPALLHSEPDLLVKIVRDVFNEDFAKLVIAGDDARATIERYLTGVAPELLERVERWEGDGDVFAAYRVGEQIDKALDRKVWLPSGGSLVIDRTEAMTVVDVNTGKFVGSGGNLEETVTKNNLEAAEEIVRQLRLRDIGGIIVVDFIDMVLETNRDLVLRRLVECLSRDRTKHQVAEVTSLGLVQMTRKRLGIGLAESMSDETVAADNRPDPQQPGRRRRGGQQQDRQQQRPAGSTHTITDGAKTALAQIAGATILPLPAPALAPASLAPVASRTVGQEPETIGAPTPAAPPVEQPSSPQAAEPRPAEPGPVEPGPAQPGSAQLGSAESAPAEPRPARSSRRASRSATRPVEVSPVEVSPAAEAPQAESPAVGASAPQSAPAQSPADATPDEHDAPAAAAHIELPATVPPERAARVPDEAAADLLDSVLGALPEPKRPGQGRRSRRVSTPALTPKHQG